MTPVGLRIDVDFPVGLRRGVPWLLDRLAEREMHATFFVVTGRNSSRRALRRTLDPEYLGRLRRLGPLRVVRCLGASLLRDEPVLESREAQAALDRIVTDGHELAAHGHDHAWWADEVWRAEPERLVEEVDRALDALARRIDAPGVAWGAPSWRTTDAVMRHLERRGVPYLAECWGREPFRTLDGAGDPIRVPHLPITAPSLEALTLDRATDAAEVVARSLGHGFGVLCAHDYFEGLLRRELFVALLDRLVAREITTASLRTVAAALAPAIDDLPACRVVRAPVPGFHGFVSWQGPVVREASDTGSKALATHGADRRDDEE
jgi:peptidoglycan/xylan/chitin deacetylase (PgdA/CDA1 family)